MRFDPTLGPLLDRLDAQCGAHSQALGAYFAERTHRFMSDALVSPHLRPGAIAVADSTTAFGDAYAPPFEGGRELTVRG